MLEPNHYSSQFMNNKLTRISQNIYINLKKYFIGLQINLLTPKTINTTFQD